jgi:hypothetical protein
VGEGWLRLSRSETGRAETDLNRQRRLLWAPNGQELFYAAPNGELMGVSPRFIF